MQKPIPKLVYTMLGDIHNSRAFRQVDGIVPYDFKESQINAAMPDGKHPIWEPSAQPELIEATLANMAAIAREA